MTLQGRGEIEIQWEACLGYWKSGHQHQVGEIAISLNDQENIHAASMGKR